MRLSLLLPLLNLYARPSEPLPASLPGRYQAHLPPGRGVPRCAGRLARVLVPAASERVVDHGHRDPSHPRVRDSLRLHRVEPRPGPEERLLEPSPSRYLSDGRPAVFADEYALPAREPHYGPSLALREGDGGASRRPDELPAVALAQLDVGDPRTFGDLLQGEDVPVRDRRVQAVLDLVPDREAGDGGDVRYRPVISVLYLREGCAPSLLVEDGLDRELAVVAGRLGVHLWVADRRNLPPRGDPEIEPALPSPSLEDSLSHCATPGPVWSRGRSRSSPGRGG